MFPIRSCWRLVLRIDENTVRPIIIRPPQDTTALIGSEGIHHPSFINSSIKSNLNIAY